jgi:hypothetical protein
MLVIWSEPKFVGSDPEQFESQFGVGYKTLRKVGSRSITEGIHNTDSKEVQCGFN